MLQNLSYWHICGMIWKSEIVSGDMRQFGLKNIKGRRHFGNATQFKNNNPMPALKWTYVLFTWEQIRDILMKFASPHQNSHSNEVNGVEQFTTVYGDCMLFMILFWNAGSNTNSQWTAPVTRSTVNGDHTPASVCCIFTHQRLLAGGYNLQ